MPELLERGHIYIAQPPLYRIKRGKQIQYVKDDKDLNEYLIQIALEEAKLFVNTKAPAISGVVLERLAKQYLNVMDIVSRLSHRYPATAMEALVYAEKLTTNDLLDEAKMQQWHDTYQKQLDKMAHNGTFFTVKMVEDKERKAFLPTIDMLSHGVESTFRLSYEFFSSNDYQVIMALGGELNGLLEEDAFIQRGDKKLAVSTFKEALAWLMEEAKKGQQISRYKGLGEMNPEQLWETTMDPAVRRMLVVRIQDAIAADQIFTTLMGDNVESRREFIESNALLAGNLDI